MPHEGSRLIISLSLIAELASLVSCYRVFLMPIRYWLRHFATAGDTRRKRNGRRILSLQSTDFAGLRRYAKKEYVNDTL